MSLSILIPCKPLGEGKSRLAPILSPAERRALCETLLTRALGLALALRPAGSIRLITPDREAAALAHEVGIAAIDDGGTGLNEALARGRASIMAGDDGAAALILPIDLPYATADAIAGVLARDADIALVPDAVRRGTNVLFVGPRALSRFVFAFGLDSFAAHRHWAEGEGLRAAIIEDPALAFDIDRPEDYRRWQQHPSGA
jgi:2-phospho-L-lactate/phosphoenolpyruvate guanylyltransferase